MRSTKQKRRRLRMIEGASDEKLMKNYQRGDKAAFNMIVQRYQDSLIRYADSIISDHARAEEIVQEVFIKLTHSQHDIQIQALKKWLYTVVRNTSYNEIRDTHRHARLQAQHYDEIPFGRSDTMTPEEVLHEQLQHTAVQDLLDELTEMHAQVLRLRYFDDLTNIEIAQKLNIEPATATTR